MLNIRNITANLITTTIVASGIAYFSLGITWAKDPGNNSENHSSTPSVGISSPSDRTSVPPRTRASSKDTLTPVFLNTPSPYPDAWVITEPSAEKSPTNTVSNK